MYSVFLVRKTKIVSKTTAISVICLDYPKHFRIYDYVYGVEISFDHGIGTLNNFDVAPDPVALSNQRR